jgi:hypothetical protein
MTTALRLRLVDLRNTHQLTNAGWARAAKQNPKDVSRFALGDMTFPPLDFLDSLSRVFHVTLAELLAADAPKASLTNAQMAVLDALAKMNPADRHMFERLIQMGQPRGGRRAK